VVSLSPSPAVPLSRSRVGGAGGRWGGWWSWGWRVAGDLLQLTWRPDW